MFFHRCLYLDIKMILVLHQPPVLCEPSWGYMTVFNFSSMSKMCFLPRTNPSLWIENGDWRRLLSSYTHTLVEDGLVALVLKYFDKSVTNRIPSFHVCIALVRWGYCIYPMLTKRVHVKAPSSLVIFPAPEVDFYVNSCVQKYWLFLFVLNVQTHKLNLKATLHYKPLQLLCSPYSAKWELIAVVK